MSGYTVFLGPIAGIMVTDVRFIIMRQSDEINLTFPSIGLCIAVAWTCPLCTTPTDATAIPTDAYVF